MPDPLTFLVKTPDSLTLEQFLRRNIGISHRMLVRLKHTDGGIRCNGCPIRSIDPVHDGDVITLHEPAAAFRPEPSAVFVPVVMETDAVLVYDKPANMPVHPSQGHHRDTLANVFAAAYPELPFRPVYRLDKDTSGLCLIAKNGYAAKKLQGNTRKIYEAIVCGSLTESGVVNAPIGRVPDSVIQRQVASDGKPAVTHYTPLAHTRRYTLVQLTLETGRTHQIRVHMAHLGHPLAGDSLYGGTCTDYCRHMLHCWQLTFWEPDNGKQIVLQSSRSLAENFKQKEEL